MTNDLAILVYLSLLIINAILVGSIIMKRGKSTFDRAYIGTCFLIIGWQICELAMFVLHDPALIGYLHTAQVALIAFIPLFFANLTAAFYDFHIHIPRWVGKSLLAIATVIALVALTNPLHGFFRVDIVVEMGPPLNRVHAAQTPWFSVALALMQIPVVGSAVIVFYQRRKLPPVYRWAVTLLLWCLVIYAIAVVVFVSGAFDSIGLDPSLIALCVVNFLFFIAAAGNARPDYLNVWRGDVFDYLDEAVLIANGKGVVVDVNQQAGKLFDFIGVEARGIEVDELWRHVAAVDKAFFKELEGEGRATVSTDLYVSDGEYPVIYEIKHSGIQGAAKAGSGEFIILTEVTRNRLSIERLKDLAGVDALTELPNRFRYEQILLEWDQPENLPLSIIMGDINNLKMMNDEYGHLAGDELLIQAASVLEDSCPPGGLVARIGGDEFVMVLRGHSKSKAEIIMQSIKEKVQHSKEFPHSVSIALGCATKVESEENLNALCAQADARMYANKKARVVGDA